MWFNIVDKLVLSLSLTFVCLAAGCNSYPWVLFRENTLSPTPYMKVANHPEPKNWPTDHITLTWIGHATVLINFYGTVILTDPVLSERCHHRNGSGSIGAFAELRSCHVPLRNYRRWTLSCSLTRIRTTGTRQPCATSTRDRRRSSPQAILLLFNGEVSQSH